MINEKNWIITIFISFLAIHISLQGVLPDIGSKKNDKTRLQSTGKTEVILPQDCIEACDDSGCLIFCPQPAKGIKRCTSSSLDKRFCCSTDGALSPVISEPAPLVTLRQRRLPLHRKHPSLSKDQKNLLKLNPSLENRLSDLKNSLSKLKSLHLDLLGRKQATKCKNGNHLSSCPEISSEQSTPKTPPLIILPKTDKKQISRPPLDENVSYEIYFPATSQETVNLPKSQTGIGILSDSSDNSEMRSVKSLDIDNSDTFALPTEPSIVQSSEHLIGNDFINYSNDLELAKPETALESSSNLKNNLVTDLINTDVLSTEPSSYENDLVHRIYPIEKLSTEKSETEDLYTDLTTKKNLISKTPSESGSTEHINYSHNPDNLVNIDSYIFPTDSSIFAKSYTANNFQNNEFNKASSGFDSPTLPKSINTDSEDVEGQRREPKELFMDQNDSVEVHKPPPLEYTDNIKKGTIENQNTFSNKDTFGETVIADKQSGPYDSTSETPTYTPGSLDHFHYEIDPMNYETYDMKSVPLSPSEVHTNENPCDSDFIEPTKLHHTQLAEVVTPRQDLIPHIYNYDLSDPLKQIDTEQHVPLDEIYGGSPLDTKDIIVLNSKGEKGTISDDSKREYQSDIFDENKRPSIAFPSVDAELKSTEYFKNTNKFTLPLKRNNEQSNLYKKYEHDLPSDFDVIHFEDVSPDREKLLIPYSQVMNAEKGQHIKDPDKSGKHEQLTLNNKDGDTYVQQQETPHISQYLNDLTKIIDKNNHEFLNQPNKTDNADFFQTKINNYQVESNVGNLDTNENAILKPELKKNIGNEAKFELNKKQNSTLKVKLDETLLEKLYDIIESDRMRGKKHLRNLTPDTKDIIVEGNNSERHNDNESKLSIKFDDSFESSHKNYNGPIPKDSTQQTLLNIEREHITAVWEQSYETTTPKNYLATDTIIGDLGDERLSEGRQKVHSNDQLSSDSVITTTVENSKNKIDQTTWKTIDPDPYIELTTINNKGDYLSKTTNILGIDMTTIKIPTKSEYLSENSKAYNKVNEQEEFHTPNPFLNETDTNNLSVANNDIIIPDAHSFNDKSESNIFSENIDKKYHLSNLRLEEESSPAGPHGITGEEQTLKMETGDFVTKTAKSMIPEIQSHVKNQTEELESNNVHYDEIYTDSNFASFNNNVEISQNDNTEVSDIDFTTPSVKNVIIMESDDDNLDAAKLISGERGDEFSEEAINEDLTIQPVTEFYNTNEDENPSSQNGPKRISSIAVNPDIIIGKEQTIKPMYEINVPDMETIIKDNNGDKYGFEKSIENVPLHVIGSVNGLESPSINIETDKSGIVEGSNDGSFASTTTYDALDILDNTDKEHISAEMTNNEELNKLVEINLQRGADLFSIDPVTEIDLLNDTDHSVDQSKIRFTNTIVNDNLINDGFNEVKDNAEGSLYKFKNNTDTSDRSQEEIKENQTIGSFDTNLMVPIFNNSWRIKELSKQAKDIQDSSETNDSVFESSTTEYSISSIIKEPEKIHTSLNENNDKGLLEINTPLELDNDEALFETEGTQNDSRNSKPPIIDSSVNNEYTNENNPEDTQFLYLQNENQSTSTIAEHSIETSTLSSSDGIVPKEISFITESEPSLELEKASGSLKIIDSNHSQETLKSVTDDTVIPNLISRVSPKNIDYMEQKSYQNQAQNEKQILVQKLNQRGSQVNMGPGIEAYQNHDEIYTSEKTHLNNISEMANMGVLDGKIDTFSNYQQHEMNAEGLDLVPLTNLKKIKIDTAEGTPHSFDAADSEALQNLNVLYKGEVINKYGNSISKKHAVNLLNDNVDKAYSLKNPTDNSFNTSKEQTLSHIKTPIGLQSNINTDKYYNLEHAQQTSKENPDTDTFKALKYEIPVDDLISKDLDATKSLLKPGNTCSCDSTKSHVVPDESKSGNLIGNIIKNVNPRSPIYIFVDKIHGDPEPNLPPIFQQKELAKISEKGHAISIRQIESPKPKYTYEFVNGQYVRVIHSEQNEGHDEQYDDRSKSESQHKSENNQEISSALNLENPSEHLVNLNDESGITKEHSLEHEKQTEQRTHTENPILIDIVPNIQDLLDNSETNSNHKQFNGKEYYVPMPIYIYIRSK